MIPQYLTMMEEINLLEDPGPAVGGDFVNDLDGVLHLSVDIDAGLDRGVCALTEHFPGKTIQLMKCVGCQGGGARGFLLLPPSSLGLFLPCGNCYGPLVFFCCKRKSLLTVGRMQVLYLGNWLDYFLLYPFLILVVSQSIPLG